MSSPPKLIIFDMDGVLVDSETIAARCFSAALAEHGIRLPSEAIDARFRGLRLADCVLRLEEEYRRSLGEHFMDQLEARTEAELARELRVVQGVDAALRGLRRAGIERFCVASSSSLLRIRSSLAQTGLASWFGASLFSGEDVARGKPAPDLFLHAADRCGVAVSDCVVVEDSDPGIAAGLAAGMRVLAFREHAPLPPSLAPEVEAFETMRVLPALVLEPNRRGSVLR